MAEQEKTPGDQPQRFAGRVIRRSGRPDRRKESVPVVIQSSFDTEGNLGIAFQAKTAEGRLKVLPPIERATAEAALLGEVIPETHKAAQRQLAAIVDHKRKRPRPKR